MSERVAGIVAYSPPPGQQDGPPQQPYQGPYPGYGPYPMARPTNGLAIAALVCGIAQFFVGVTFLPAIICGYIARRQIRQTGEQGDGMALAGIILGYIGAVLLVLVVLGLALFVTRFSNSVTVSNSVGVPAPGN
jgi:Domain of unknown function (DUF4190)